MLTIWNTVHDKYFYCVFFMSSPLEKGLLACFSCNTTIRSFNATVVLPLIGQDMMIAKVSGRHWKMTRKNFHTAPTSKSNDCRSDPKPRFVSQKKMCNTAGSEDVGLWYKKRRHLQDRLLKYQDSSTDTQTLGSSSRNSKSTQELRL